MRLALLLVPIVLIAAAVVHAVLESVSHPRGADVSRASTARARTVIDVITAGAPMPVEIGFESRDIGATQGTTLTLMGVIVAEYRPGTSHWDSALESAVNVVRSAADAFPDGRSVRSAEAWRAAIAGVLAAHGCAAWDGTEPDWETL